MSCYLLVKNLPTRWQTGMIVDVFPDGHKFGRLEDKSLFMSAGGQNENWPRIFIIVKVTDIDANDDKIKKLTNREADNLPAYRLKPQGKESPYYNALLNKAYIEAPWHVVEMLIEAVSDGD